MVGLKDSDKKRDKIFSEFQQCFSNDISNFRYEYAPHHRVVDILPPSDGKTALQNSFSLNESTMDRIGFSNNEVVKFIYKGNCTYNGYQVKFDQLDNKIQKELQKRGMDPHGIHSDYND